MFRGANGQLWQVNGNPQYPGNFDAANGAQNKYWFTTTNPDGTPIFTAPAAGTFVNQAGVRNLTYAPGFNNWNLGLFKKFAITERFGFQFRAEAFDAFNHPNLSGAGIRSDQHFKRSAR